VSDNVRIEVCRTVFAGTRWFLLKHGTVVVLKDDPLATDELAIRGMSKLAADLGPYEGEGSPLGDCNPMKLKAFPGWLVSFGDRCRGMFTYVGPEETEGTPPPPQAEVLVYEGTAVRPATPDEATDHRQKAADLMAEVRVALFGRHKRNLDARNPEIVARSTDA
jgi:hypothetical protein